MIAALALFSCQGPNPNAFHYPEAHAVDSTTTYFETKVKEPYVWLENDTSKETGAWVEAENAFTQDYLKQIPFRQAYRDRLAQLTDFEKQTVPQKTKKGYFYFKNDGLQNQDLLYFTPELGGNETLILDPNKLSEDGTVALTDYSVSKDGTYMAYSISRNGSDWTEIYVLNLETKETLKDQILWAKFTTIQWKGQGFFYSGYTPPKDNSETSTVKNTFQKVFYHTLGTDYTQDVVIYENPSNPLSTQQCYVMDDEHYLFIVEAEGTSGNRLLVKDLNTANASIQTAINDLKTETTPVGTLEGKVYLLTNKDAPNNRVVRIDPQNPSLKDWEEIIPEGKNKLVSVDLANHGLLLNYLEDAKNHVYNYSAEGEKLAEIKLNKQGSINNISCSEKSPTIYFNFESFTTPQQIYTCSLEDYNTQIYWTPKLKFNPEDFVEQQVFFTSKDGTRIPMTIIYKKGLVKNGQTPTIMYGYGGFDISLSPYFKVRYMPYLENGGIYCVVNLRGGGEYGSKWHDAGIKMNKQNVFDDFYAATEYMIKEGYTCPEKLACNGGSNGGLLVGAALTQRPDLFAVAVPEVGVLDMMKYNQFTIGWAWASDYGTAQDSPEMADYLMKYSPLHNIKEGVKYPSTFIMTGDHDDRVVPAHSFKFAAKLQAESRTVKDANPLLIRVDSKAGHGGGKPIGKLLDAEADKWAFILYELGETYPKEQATH